MLNQNPKFTFTLQNFVKSSQYNTLTYSNFSFIEKIKDQAILYPIHNIVNDYLVEIKAKASTIVLNDLEHYRYSMRPKLLANDIYGNTELYFIILLINDMCNTKDFTMKTIKMLKPSDLYEMLEQIYNNEKINLNIYNKGSR